MLYLMENEYMTTHKVMAADSSSLSELNDRSVDLIVTSPPYPMIEMWDEVFSMQDKSIADCMENGKGHEAFAKMHAILDRTWLECDRVLKSSGFICINIGDATRKLNDSFELYPNHSRIIDFFFGLGYSVLPDIHWRKQSNSPNKFMGSGMYPDLEFIESLSDENKKKCYQNTPHGFKVKTRQETAIELNMLEDIISIDDGYICRYKKYENADTDEQIKLSLT